MKKIEIIFKLSQRSRKSYKWEKFCSGITGHYISHIEREICIKHHVNTPVILSLREIPYISNILKYNNEYDDYDYKKTREDYYSPI